MTGSFISHAGESVLLATKHKNVCRTQVTEELTPRKPSVTEPKPLILQCKS